MTIRRRNYEPPMARDLSHLRARGGTITPLGGGGGGGGGVIVNGTCMDGAGISSNYTCTRGLSPQSNPATCTPLGSLPTVGGCGKGNAATTLCSSGATDY
jgi:hypothetical protein